MKKLISFIMIVILLTMNISNIAHADCSDEVNSENNEVINSVNNDSNNDDKNLDCDDCSCHHPHSFFLQTKSIQYSFKGTSRFLWDNQIDISQLQYLLARPPKV